MPTATVDWDMFCHETCKVMTECKSEKIGGPGKVVQIDESKVGKQKHNHGHRVDRQWIFGGIEDRSEAALLPIFQKWIEP